MHIWGMAHRVRRRGGLGVTSRDETGQQPPRGLRGSPIGLQAGAERRERRCKRRCKCGERWRTHKGEK